MVTNEQMRRLEQLEAEARKVDMGPALERLAAEHDLDPDDIVREAWRIREATEGLSREQKQAWFVQDLASATSLTEAEARVEVQGWDVVW